MPVGAAIRAGRARLVAPAVALFLTLLAAQAGVLVLAPILVDVARDFGVSTATAGQVRTLTGLVAGVTALLLGRLAGGVALRTLLAGGTLLLALSSLLTALAPSFAVFALAQIPTGIAVAVLVSGGVAGAAEWVEPAERARVVAWALAGQAAAWVVGMPLVGAAADVSWRLAFALPVATALVAAGVLSVCRAGPAAAEVARVPLRTLLRDRAVAAWALGELLAFSAWAGILVFAGALLIESYGASPSLTGLVLAAGGASYIAGNFALRGLAARSTRGLLIVLALLASVGAAVLGAARPALAVTALVFAALSAIAGGRTLAGSLFGLDAAPERKLAVTSARTAAGQFGYLVGSAVGGAALAVHGYPALGLALAALFAAAAVPHLLRGG
ncbi:MAG: MFS transporter [Thermoleophilia bacterium]|nr:MFS transporter [Thermoleophilia bacterium]